MTEREKSYINENYNKEHTAFSGLIYESDFNTGYKGANKRESLIAKRIMSDLKFDQQCQRNIEKNKNVKGEPNEKTNI